MALEMRPCGSHGLGILLAMKAFELVPHLARSFGLGIDGQLMVVGASADPIEVSPMLLISGRRSIAGWPSGTAPASEDTLRFSVLTDVRPMIEIFPLSKAAEAYQRMMSGKARFRVVLKP